MSTVFAEVERDIMTVSCEAVKVADESLLVTPAFRWCSEEDVPNGVRMESRLPVDRRRSGFAYGWTYPPSRWKGEGERVLPTENSERTGLGPADVGEQFTDEGSDNSVDRGLGRGGGFEPTSETDRADVDEVVLVRVGVRRGMDNL